MKNWKSGFIIFFLPAVFFGCSKEKRADKAAKKMQEFVINISNYARSLDASFIVIPQNGIELAFNSVEPTEGLYPNYMDAVNGFGVESLFYEGTWVEDDGRLSMLQQLKTTKKVMVSDYVSDNNNISDAINRNNNEGFICFPRISSNYDYTLIPDSVIHENTNNIITLNDAQNFLYLISSSNYASKQAMIAAIAATNFDVILIDLFFEDAEFTSAEIDQLKTKANGGNRLVIAYMNIGAAENFRYYWKDKWKLHHPSWLKKKYQGYDDEIWVNFWDTDWQNIIYGNDDSYTKKIINAGFDGAYLDNVEAYYFLYYND